MQPFPMQRLFLKCVYRMPMDDTQCDIEITDKTGENVLHTFTERQALKWLHAEGKTNINEEMVLDTKKFKYSVIELILGRRGDKMC